MRRESPSGTILFTGYAPVHFACFRPLFERLRAQPDCRVYLSGGLRTKTDSGYEYDLNAMYGPFGVPRGSLLPVEALPGLDVDLLFAGNTKMIAPRTAGTRVQIFHGVSFRNKAVRGENLKNDFFFIVGPYMHRAFERAGLLRQDDPRGLRIGFLKTDRLLDGSLDRDAIIRALGFTGDRPIALYAPTGQRHNSLETMGPEVIHELAESGQVDLLIKPHDHPKNTSVDWFDELRRFESEHVRVTREPDVIPLLFAADLLITDASSVSNEYALLDRPMIFLDVPKLLKRARKAEGSMVDLDTWGRRGGVIVRQPQEITGAVDRSLSHPDEFSEIRRAMAADLFYNPGRSVDAAMCWLDSQLARAAA